MLQDPADQFIKSIRSNCSIDGKAVLEIGCGGGRITCDLVKYARTVVATDPDAAALEKARASVVADNVQFLLSPNGLPDLPPESFDVVIYTLSFHHVPPEAMTTSLKRAGNLLRRNGVIVVIEPGNGGSFNEAKQRFGAGSGDETPLKQAAIRAMHRLQGWSVGETVFFQTGFLFADEQDFCKSKLPHFDTMPALKQAEIMAFLGRHKTDSGILLASERRLNVLSRVTD
jgi:SAM-dependent methyltransferase